MLFSKNIYLIRSMLNTPMMNCQIQAREKKAPGSRVNAWQTNMFRISHSLIQTFVVNLENLNFKTNLAY